MRPLAVCDADVELSQKLCAFIEECPSPFHTVAAIRTRLDASGFCYVPEAESWHIERGGSYYTTRNGSSIIAFTVGHDVERPFFKMVASHSDSPTLKVKSVPELVGPDSYVRLNVEGYGGLIDRTWLDRPLGIAGRVFVQDDSGVRCHLFAPDEDLLIIPSVAIHLDRKVNEQGALNRQVDMCPLFSAGGIKKGGFAGLVADRLGVDSSQIVSHDLVLVNRQRPCVWGGAKEFVSAPRLDDLQCTFAGMMALTTTHVDKGIQAFACFDNEEVGSGTMQGALSSFMADMLGRMAAALGIASSELVAARARSFLVSCDNAHAVHPAHPERYDDANRVWINQGVVIKESAAQRYTTSAQSRALFSMLCRRAGVPIQSFANRSDSLGGSTLGNLLTRQVSMHSVDIGLPQLAMHSAYETAGTLDTGYLITALREFYAADFSFGADGSVLL